MKPELSSLPWLPVAPENISKLIKAATGSTSPGNEILKLSGYQLNAAQAGKLSKLIKISIQNEIDLAPLADFKLGIISNSTIDIVADELPAAAARHSVALAITRSEFGQYMQQALNPESELNRGELDAVLVALDHHWFDGHPARPKSVEALTEITTIIDSIREHGGAACIIQTIPIPPISLFGSYDLKVISSLRARISSFNQELVKHCKNTNSYLLDIASLAERIGTDNWFNPVQWHAYKLAYSGEFNAIYSDMLGRLVGAIRGNTKKCLVLDLDNTLWGGAIGDEGLEGIKLGQGSALGEAFTEIQKMALALKQRGIVLAVCSKNNDEVARSPFREHPEMILKEDDIAVFQANWTDKASNLEAIAATLNIGVEALVLLDDNPVERIQVRTALPSVGVPELPADPSWYPWFLCGAGFFEAASFTEDDKLRADTYAANAKRTEVQAKSRDLGNYLTSLNMQMNVAPFDDNGVQRITQLINKTNQFNLTTTRLTQGEVVQFQNDTDSFTLQFRLEDSFGDLGMISVVILTRSENTWNIHSWLMSCRVLGRKVEEAMLASILKLAVENDIADITATYKPTSKNNMVRDHYDKLGFELVSEDKEKIRSYRAKTTALKVASLPITVSFANGTRIESGNSEPGVARVEQAA